MNGFSLSSPSCTDCQYQASSTTKPVYQYDASIRELATEIISCQPLSSLDSADRELFKNMPDEDGETNTKNHVVTVKETIFHPKGGGQPSDTGIIKTITIDHQKEAEDEVKTAVFQVELVRKSAASQIFHAGHFTSTTTTFTPGQQALQILDSAKRDYHSRLHTAGHIIDVAVDLLIAAGTGTGNSTSTSTNDTIGPLQKSKANHAPGSACVEWLGHIPSSLKLTIEAKANEIVQKNLPVNILWWTEEQLRVESEGTVVPPDTIPPPENGLYRVVDIGGLGSACPCGGTHLPRTGDVGAITVRKVSRQKGVSRVSYEVVPAM